jgi:uncharacterized membrane protein YkvA (DUF1232 family)
MNFITQFIKGNWLGRARLYSFNPQKMKVLLFQLGLYLTKNGLSSAKETLLLIRDYLCDVSTGKYKDYELKKLTIIVGAIIYVVTPVDLLPDFIPAGFVDDLSILGWAASQAAAELKKYKEVTGLENKLSEK